MCLTWLYVQIGVFYFYNKMKEISLLILEIGFFLRKEFIYLFMGFFSDKFSEKNIYFIICCQDRKIILSQINVKQRFPNIFPRRGRGFKISRHQTYGEQEKIEFLSEGNRNKSFCENWLMQQDATHATRINSRKPCSKIIAHNEDQCVQQDLVHPPRIFAHSPSQCIQWHINP